MKLSQFLPGQTGIIKEFTDLEMSVKLMEMGCMPGEKISIEQIAPFKDPISIAIAGYKLSLRLDEAESITVELFI